MQNIILDTSALLYDPDIMFKAKGNVIISYGVLQELDGLKKSPQALGFTARHIIKKLYQIWQNGFEYKTKNGVIKSFDKVPMIPVDDYLIDVTKSLNGILVTMDINLFLKAKINNVNAIIYEGKSTELYNGYREIKVPRQVLLDIWAGKPFKFDRKPLYPNMYIRLYNGTEQALMRFVGANLPLQRVNNKNKKIQGVTPKNFQQYFLLDALLDPDIKLITVAGPSGTGKTLLTMAASLELMFKHRYDSIKINKAPVPVGKDHGYLPGTLDEKLKPWISPFLDAIEFIKSKGGSSIHNMSEEDLLNKNIDIEAVTYIRGRSIRNSIILIEEAQNRSLAELKTIITRVGEGTKIVLLGDVEQIDNFYLNQYNNGLSQVAYKFKNDSIAAHITLKEGIRSDLATKASQLL